MTEYFAYGSNVSAAVMRATCSRHHYLGRARLPGHRLAFTRRSVRTGTGVADVVADARRDVWGALYAIEAEDLDALDRKEGAGWAYERRSVRVHADGGAAHEAIAYFVKSPSPVEIPPSTAYARQLTEAARERELPDEYIAALSASLAALRAQAG
jgi:gamma-glutamylcyclotransferase